MHFRILKMIATSGFLTALECTKFDFGRGSAPDLAGKSLQCSPRSPTGLRGPTSKGRGGKGTRKNGRGGRRRARGGTGNLRMEGKG